ncbi:MAG: DnaA regulatory inactivator Hda [Gammaproteobacteria bacterium]|nr:DnaA regulatory inactivator Hda [Gammaproteobacteria bacterium]
MKNAIHQLTLGVSLKDHATFDNYFSGSNTHLVQELFKAAQGSSSQRVIYFYGAGGQGFTHLLQASCHEAHRQRRTAAYLPFADYKNFSPALFEGLETLNLVCFDDTHLIAGVPQWEEAFFHAFNRIYDAGGTLIFTANCSPRQAGFRLPDLVSRLSWGIVFQLQPLTDVEKLAMLMMRAQRRGMTLSEEVGRFILTHCPRHMSTLCTALDVLDRTSLAAQRRLTIPFVKTVLEI